MGEGGAMPVLVAQEAAAWFIFLPHRWLCFPVLYSEDGGLNRFLMCTLKAKLSDL